ncbi:hypothetical protein G9A89_011543 [Geosiphon pyriformis]|nr:hypothetical protein G9A89_011543 [Geosiphon pyriformis]
MTELVKSMGAEEKATYSQTSNTSKSSKNFDPTGRRYVFKIRGSSYPPLKRSIEGKPNEIVCKRCVDNEQYIDVLETHVDNIERAVEDLSTTLEKAGKRSINEKYGVKTSVESRINFSKVNTEGLLEISEKISQPKNQKS